VSAATGGRAWLPDEGVEGIEHALTSQHVLEFEDEHFAELPRSIAIVGSGYIGCEFASIFHEFGVRTTLLARGTHVLSGFDHDVRAAVTENLMVTGVDLRRSTILDSISKQSDGAFALRGSGGFNLTVDKVIFAIGRIPLSRGLGLEEVGVQLDAKGAVVVNEFSRTSVPNIYAVGDLTNRVNLTPVAIAEGRAFAETLFNSSPTAVE
jgi:glutathione reductase (NADPH)